MPSHPSPPLPNEHAPPKVKKFSLREKENLPQSTVDKGTYFSSSAALSLASSLQKSFSEEAERKSPTTQGPLPITRANIHKKAHSNAKKTAALELTSTSLPFFHNSLFSSSSSLSSLQNRLI